MKRERLLSENPYTVFVLYEPWQVEELECLWRERPREKDDSLVIALGLDIEAKLDERGIAYASGRIYKRPFPDLLATEDKMLDAFFVDSRWKAFVHRGISLPTTFRFVFRIYLQRVWYYSNLLISIVESHPSVTRLTLFAPHGVAFETAGVLATKEIWAVTDCAKTIAAVRGLSVSIIATTRSASTAHFLFSTRRTLFSLFLMIWNATIATLVRPRRPRLVISDYWRNVGSSIELFKEAECIFLDRTEIRNINWRALLRYRMRFVHSENFLSRGMRARAKDRAQELARAWDSLRASIAPVFLCRGYSLDPIFLQAMDAIVRGFEKTICEIEGTYSLYEHLQPDIVMLRASVSGQTHFSVLPMVAEECATPSLELQHGLEYLGPGSLSREHTAEYLAVYGSLVKKELLLLGHAPERVREIGSPRFDAHRASVTTSASREFTMLCIAPDIRPFEMYDSYSAEDYFTAVAKAIEAIPNARAIVKLRSGPADKTMLRAIIARAFSNVPHTIAQYEPLPDLFAQADTAVSCYSTAILEALQCGMPVIIPALNPVDRAVVDFHFSPYRDAHALRIAYSHQELADALTELAAHPDARDRMRVGAQEFLTKNFCFDGNSSRRFAALITELVHK